MTAPVRKSAALKAADDNPFDFNLDAVEAEVDATPFRIHWAGKRWSFEHMQNLDMWDLVAAASGGEVGATIGVFKAALGEATFKEFRKHPLPQFKANKLFEAYALHCGIDPGELQGSTDS